MLALSTGIRALSLSGLFFGMLVAYYTPRELSWGKKGFLLGSWALTFYGLFISFGPLGLLGIAALALHKKNTVHLYYTQLTLLTLTVLHPSFDLAQHLVIFAWGFPIGTLLKKPTLTLVLPLFGHLFLYALSGLFVL